MPLVEEVHDALFSLKSNASVCDQISVVMFKYCSPFIERYFPELWKQSVVRPIQAVVKSHTDLRPISLLPLLPKILQRIVYRQINNQNCILFLKDNQILGENRSTSTALSSVLDE